MTTKKITFEKFLSLTRLAILIPDWDAYEYDGNLFISEKSVLHMIYFNLIWQNDRRPIIQLKRYKFMPFKPQIDEVMAMIQLNQTISAHDIAIRLLLTHGIISWRQAAEKPPCSHLEILDEIKTILSTSGQNTAPSEWEGLIADAQTLLTKWSNNVTTVEDGDYFATGETVQIDLQELNLAE